MTDADALFTLEGVDAISIANMLLEGVWVCDRDAVTAFVNPRMAGILLTTPEAMIGVPLFDFFHDDDRAMVKARWRERLTGQRGTYEARLVRSDGSIAHARVHASPVESDGRIVGTAAAVVDITDMRQVAIDREDALRDAEEAQAATMRLLSWVSHELRTPLNTISGFAQLLQTTLASDTDRTMAANIVAASSHVNSLVQDLLDYARAEANALEPTLVPVPLDDAVRDAVALVQGLADERQVRVRATPSDLTVIADRRHLVQVLTNLVSNAVKYGGERSTVEITADRSGAMVRCQVTDHGPGIPAHRQRDIFRPFHRLENSSGISGAGLGLSICDAYTRAMKGTLAVRSEVGAGTTFTLELPDANQSDGTSPTHPATDTPPANALVLYVEDEPLNAALVSSVIALLPGRELHVAATVAEGIEAAAQLRPALYLLDLNLPDGSGLDVLAAIRADPTLAHATVYMLSADATEQSTARAEALGADRFITKPFDLSEFLALVEAATMPSHPVQ